jgi:RNA polymerase sigma-70 factor (ECF subfamily)
MVSAMDYEQAEDRQLIEAICSSDRAALEALYTRYSGPVYSLAMRMLRDAGAAEEVAQDTFFNIWRRANSYKAPRGSVTSWLFSIAHNRTIDELRKRKRHYNRIRHGVDLSNKASESREHDPTEYATAQFEGSRLKDALTTLRPEQREVVVLAYFGGLTHSEISKHLDQPLGTVKTRMRLAIKKLRNVLEPQIQESAEHGV